MSSSSDNIDLSLDDIIKKNKRRSLTDSRKTKSKSGNNNKTKNYNNIKDKSISKNRNSAKSPKPAKQLKRQQQVPRKQDQQLGKRLIISNLANEVSDEDIRELFQEFGPIQAAGLQRNRNKRPLGSAFVIFKSEIHALKAKRQYDGVPLDSRPMKIDIIQTETPKKIIEKKWNFKALKNNGYNNATISPRNSAINRRNKNKKNGINEKNSGKIIKKKFSVKNNKINNNNKKKSLQKAAKVTLEQLNAELDSYIQARPSADLLTSI